MDQSMPNMIALEDLLHGRKRNNRNGYSSQGTGALHMERPHKLEVTKLAAPSLWMRPESSDLPGQMERALSRH